MRLWSARFTDRRAPKGVTPIDERDHGLLPADLAVRIHRWTARRKTVWAYAHNLHFDLQISNLANELIWLGWKVTDFALDSASPWLRLHRRECTLTVCDSFSWLPVKLAEVGEAIGRAKPPLPSESDPEAVWLERCRADVTILAEAMLKLMSWWDRCDLGRWSVTGAAAGWNVMRHRPILGKVLIRPDQTECDDDRAAIYGGKRYCWRTGTLPPGRYAELDIERAYTVACRDLPLPSGRMARFGSLTLDHPWLACDRQGVIARVLLNADQPRWPARCAGRVWYPVGRFWTTLAGPDIREAIMQGAVEQIGPGWVHSLGRAFTPWADWCLSAQADQSGETPDLAKIVLRHWGRTSVGKWAQRGFETIPLGTAPTDGWDTSDGWHHGAGARMTIVDFGGQRWQVTAAGEADNAYPAILAWVESYVRVAIGRASSLLGDDVMVSCDTDGMIIDVNRLTDRAAPVTGRISPARPKETRAEMMIALAGELAAPFHLREKRSYHQAEIIGPQHMRLDGKARMSGIPASAIADRAGVLHALVWPKLAWQMAHGRPGEYVRPTHTYRLAAVYAPGWVLADGAVRPVELSADRGDTNHIVPWPLTRHARSGDRLGAHQVRELIGYAQTA